MREEERQAVKSSDDEQEPRRKKLCLDEIQFTDAGAEARTGRPRPTDGENLSQGVRFVKQEREHCILWRLKGIPEKDEVFFGEEE